MLLILLLFMYIFSFKIGEYLNSTIIVVIFLIIYLLLFKGYRREVKKICTNKKILIILSSLLAIITYSLFLSTILYSYDYSITSTFVNQFVNLIIGILLFSLYIYKKTEKKILKHLIGIFIIQSLIQLISFLSPDINEVLNFFRDVNAIEKGQEGYGGLRGLALSGSAFFGLSIAFGLIYIYYIFNWKRVFNNSLNYLFFTLLLFGGMSAGRTAYIGLIIALLFGILNKIYHRELSIVIKKLKPISIISLMSLILIGGLLLYILSLDTQTSEKFEKFSAYGFQMFYNLKEKGQFSTSSTDNLFNMYFNINESQTILIGDGIYTNEDGSYYMNTDAGYMRNILYFGVTGILFLLIYQLTFFDWKNRNLFIRNLAIIAYILVVHIKGDALGFSIMMQNILLLMLLNDYKSRTYTNEKLLISNNKRII